MKKLFLAMLLWVTPAIASTVNFPQAVNGAGGITAIFLNTTVATPPAPGVWQTVDVTSFGLPSNTLAVDLGGFLIITNGSNTGTSDLTIAFRRYGDTQVTCGNYISQTIAPNPPSGNGTRAQANIWVALNQGKFEWCWQRGIVGSSWPTGALQPWPTDPAFAINLNVEAWVTP